MTRAHDPANFFRARGALDDELCASQFAFERVINDVRFTLDFSKRNACHTNCEQRGESRVMDRAAARDVLKSKVFLGFFDKIERIRLALFFEMLTMANIMGDMIIKLVKLKHQCRVGK